MARPPNEVYYLIKHSEEGVEPAGNVPKLNVEELSTIGSKGGTMKTPNSKIQVFFVFKIQELGFFWSFIRTPLKIGIFRDFPDFPI